MPNPASLTIVDLALHAASICQFHRQKTGPMGRHSWCKPCYSGKFSGRVRTDPPENRRSRNLRSRYGIGQQQVTDIVERQGGLCGICGGKPKKPCIDHDHRTGRVRGVLCHGCNIKLSAIENQQFMELALRYLGAPCGI